MFGSQYARHQKLLIASLHDMNQQYGSVLTGENPILKFLQTIYIKIFGIPEIGFQVRGMYFRKALEALKKRNINKILDIGSGIGTYSFYLCHQFPRSQITGIEIDRYKLKVSTSLIKEFKAKNVLFKYGDITRLTQPEKYFDLAISVDVLEHINKYHEALINISNLLVNGGNLYLHVPNVRQKRHFPGFKDWIHPDHARVGFNRTKLTKELHALGFRIIKSEYTFGLFGSFAWELNHLMIKKSMILNAVLYPIFYVISLLDPLISNREGLGLSVLAVKIK